MKPETAKSEFEKRIQKVGAPMSELTPAQGVRLMLDFYRDVRAEGCDLSGDGDMLLFQWGTYDFFGEGSSFQFNITRQFVLTMQEDEDDDSAISQLSFTFHFAPSAQFDALNGNRWCGMPEALADFEAFIAGNDAYRAVATARPAKVTLDYLMV